MAMSTETILNLIWLLLSAAFLAAVGFSDMRRSRRANRISRPKRLVAVFIAALFIFPCISASDDLWAFQNLLAIPESRKVLQSPFVETSEIPTWRLARFFESLQSFPLSLAFSLSVLFCFLGMIFIPSSSTRWRFILSGSSRSPPLASPLF